MSSQPSTDETTPVAAPTSEEQAYVQAEAIVERAKREADTEAAAIVAQAKKEASDIVAKANATLAAERRKTMIELSGTVVDLAVDIAGKIVGSELSEDAQRRLAKKYLEEVSG